MFAHTRKGKLIHIADEGRMTRCQKKVDPTWLTHEESLAAGGDLEDCPACGTVQEFENHRAFLREQATQRRERARQVQALAADVAQAKTRCAQILAAQITEALKGLHIQAHFAHLPAGARVDATYKEAGHVFQFSFHIH